MSERCVATVPVQYGQAHTSEGLALAVLKRLGIPAKREWACYMADAYARPRLRSELFERGPKTLARLADTEWTHGNMVLEIHRPTEKIGQPRRRKYCASTCLKGLANRLGRGT